MTTNRLNSAKRLAGFTLVEILIVIVIIGLLAGMTTTVVVSARRSVNNSVISTQMAQLSMALDEYKNKFGEYPPDLSDEVSVMRHIKKRWPRYNVTYRQFLDHIQYGCRLSSSRLDTVTSLDELDGQYVWNCKAYISSLVFWLGGLPDQHGVPSGFYASPKYPLGISANDKPIGRPGRAKKEKPFYSFEKKYLGAYGSGDYDGMNNYYYKIEDNSSLWDGSIGAYVYIPAYCQGDFPLLYFRPTVTSPYTDKRFFLSQSAGANDNVSCAVPYAQDASSWYEEKRFQLIHPGDDGLFGNDLYVNPRIVVKANRNNTLSNDPITLEDADNLTNFIESGTLESLYD